MRLEPTLKTARRERERFAIKARLNGIALNVAIGMQVLLGALTTGLAAATRGRSTSIVVAIFGGASTCVATYLARARGTGEPENSKIRVRLLDHFIRDCDHIIFDEGYHVGHIRDHYDDRLDELRRRLEEILGNNSDNSMP
ncbi:hypothetical protein PUNSTDRAFT_108690 [Punctularia strigosozonata HHB-11173 SS5]|uniref:SMODS and SLOG-associating 2TM effector domain-containing protein n=1 Tax=Punctularia strigosozonata (strain HHB-11173) TaxID=741275 RepID=R7S1F3_PUNST|nr:uncharacterized protein PUNSTDRAFT_108690 [Punctularia strigosozonata HHB-11173 SS5]EIN04205.1 hypothetical protein PUNSTDRAFT_108690 [Punctularia strigosozonata HHB-11173 SS5]